jgi:peptidylprolyl isomerase
MKFPTLVLLGAALVAAGGAQAAKAPKAPAAAAAPAALSAPTEADWRTPDPQNILIIDTNKGRIIVELAPEVAPQTTARIRELAHANFYDGQTFFRVIDDFMDQTGDPTNTGRGGSTKPDIPGEFTFRRSSQTPMVVVAKDNGLEEGFIGSLPVIGQTLDLALLTADGKVSAWGTFCPAVLGMARSESPDSGNSQFFMMRGLQTNLDQKYTAFGRVIAGEDVVKSIKTGEPAPDPQDKMTTMRVLADLPAASRPSVRVIDTRGPWFTAMVASQTAQKGSPVSVCDLDLPSQIK